MSYKLTIPARRIALVLGAIAVYLALQSIVGKYVQDSAGGEGANELLDVFVRIFNINREQSFPTWYSSSMLLLGGVTTAFIAAIKWTHREPHRFYWVGLSALFIYLSSDEGAGLHEYLTDPIGEALDTTGPLYFGWIVAGIIAVVVIGLLFFRFWLAQDSRTRLLYFLAAGLYVGGGIGVEMVGSNLWYLEGGSTLAYSTVGTIEELMEMLGAIVFLYAQLQYLARHIESLQLRFVDGRPQLVSGTSSAAETL
jgi:hypothetical protein